MFTLYEKRESYIFKQEVHKDSFIERFFAIWNGSNERKIEAHIFEIQEEHDHETVGQKVQV